MSKEEIEEYIEANYEELQLAYINKYLLEEFDKPSFYEFCEERATNNFANKIDSAYDEWKENHE